MTYAKKGTEFSDECAQVGLSDAAYRTHDEAIIWLYRVESRDMRIGKHLVRRFAGSIDWESAVAELVAARFWKEDNGGYVVVHHAKVIRQSLASQRDKRRRDRDAKRAERAREKTEKQE